MITITALVTLVQGYILDIVCIMSSHYLLTFAESPLKGYDSGSNQFYLIRELHWYTLWSERFPSRQSCRYEDGQGSSDNSMPWKWNDAMLRVGLLCISIFTHESSHVSTFKCSSLSEKVKTSLSFLFFIVIKIIKLNNILW